MYKAIAFIGPGNKVRIVSCLHWFNITERVVVGGEGVTPIGAVSRAGQNAVKLMAKALLGDPPLGN